jgi:hypothetical protein
MTFPHNSPATARGFSCMEAFILIMMCSVNGRRVIWPILSRRCHTIAQLTVECRTFCGSSWQCARNCGISIGGDEVRDVVGLRDDRCILKPDIGKRRGELFFHGNMRLLSFFNL